MSISDKQIESILSLSGEDRYRHFIKAVIDREEMWGLYQNGWAMAAADSGQAVFPLWPYKEYAELCAVDKWAGYKPRSIPVDDVIEILLPKLEKEHALVGVFYTPLGKGVTPTMDEFKESLKEEKGRY